MSRLAKVPGYVFGVAREIGLGVDTAHAIFHGAPVSDRVRRHRAPHRRR